MTRNSGRTPDESRTISIEPGFVRTADGSALISIGETRVICTASVDTNVPKWMAGKGSGWVTAEYGMLPASTGERKRRDKGGKQDGRSVEIQRLIGRSLRCAIDMNLLGERSVYVDCDVLQADGGTRCASITGGYVALHLALQKLIDGGELERMPLVTSVAAISAGIVDGEALLDLEYIEDSQADVDANVVMTGDDGLVEVQATAERTPLSKASLDELLELSAKGIAELRAAQAAAVGGELSGLDLMPELVLSTRNAHKVHEFNGLLPGWDVLPLPDEVELPPETGKTFAENALVKARTAAEATGMAAIADDSGISAHALNGAPGVYSARYAGEDASDEANLDKLMREVAATDDATVEYVCAVAYVEPDGHEEVFEGRCAGVLIEEKRGEGGFGYDPAVVPDDYDDGRTMAELTQEEKDAISHRGRAARDLLRWLDSLSAG